MGVIHDATVGTEGGSVGRAVAAIHAMPLEIGIEPVKRAGGHVPALAHGAGPEASGGVALAVVEALSGQVRLGIDDRLDPPAVEVDEGEAAAQGGDEAAADATDRLGHRPTAGGAGCRRVAVYGRRLDVDPVDRALVVVPDRSLAEQRPRRPAAPRLGGLGPARSSDTIRRDGQRCDASRKPPARHQRFVDIHGGLGELEFDIAAMLHDLGANLDHLLSECRP